MNILFVCTGNTCRSPMAQGLFKKLISDKNMGGITCESCGLFTRNGMPASFFAIKVCEEVGVDISFHRSRMITEEILKGADIIFVMTSSHKNMLLEAGVSEDKIYLPNEEISDPYMGDIEDYQRCRDQIFCCLEDFLTKLKNIKN